MKQMGERSAGNPHAAFDVEGTGDVARHRPKPARQSSTLPMSGVWKRSQGRTSEAPPDERGGNRYVRPTATAPHSDSTVSRHPGSMIARVRLGWLGEVRQMSAIGTLLKVSELPDRSGFSGSAAADRQALVPCCCW